MVNSQYLEEKIVMSGKKKSFLAERCGLSRGGFWKKCSGESEFNASEIKALCGELGIKSLVERDRIFFA